MTDPRGMLEEIMTINPDAFIIDGHDNAIIGMTVQHGSLPVVLYDSNKIIDNLMMNDDMDYDDAVEFFSFNIECAYVGKNTPMFLVRLDNRGVQDETRMEEDDS